MLSKRFTTEQIIQRLREAEVLFAQGKTIAQVCKKIGITDQTDYRWQVRSICDQPRAPVDGKPGTHVELDVSHIAGRKHLPIVTVRRIA